MLHITPFISIDESEIGISFVRASGPGGQHVNKVSTAVQLRFDVRNTMSLTGPVKARLAKLAGSRMTEQGVLIIDARESRSQAVNRKAALDRLTELIRQAATPPKRRTPTKPTKASREKRLESKQTRSQTKRLRRGPAGDE
jgi:ribosome-associated protein